MWRELESLKMHLEETRRAEEAESIYREPAGWSLKATMKQI